MYYKPITAIENNIMKNLQSNFDNHLNTLTLGKEAYFDLIHKKLVEIYGDRVRWKNFIDCYVANNPVVRNIDDFSLLDTYQLRDMIINDISYDAAVESLLHDALQIRVLPTCERNLDLLYRVSGTLGIYPIFKSSALQLNSRFVDFSDMTRESLDNIFLNATNRTNLHLIVNWLLDYYTDGFQVTYPNAIAGTVLTQPKRQYYYRGENAYFGSSKASAYRGYKSYTELDDTLRIMKYHEAGLFLDNFNAMKKWHYGNVNHKALMQHYGLKTSMIDITSDIMVALFFACCKWKNGQWKPLEEKDFEHKDSRKYISAIGGDSRYAILYRQSAEIDDMRCGLHQCKNGMDTVIPVGHQPFMRCQTQSAYMLDTSGFSYDLYQDRLFEKFKFRLTKDFCQEIFDEMDGGEKIYPAKDIPNISYFINTIEFSKEIPINIINEITSKEDEKQNFKRWLKEQGYEVVSKRSNFIMQREIYTINNKYNIAVAEKLADCKPHYRPMITIA